MERTTAPDQETSELAALRARLYRPGAGPADVRRYEAARDRHAGAPGPARTPSAVPGRDPPAPTRTGSRSPPAPHRRRRLAGLAVAVVLGGLGGLVAQAPPDTDLARTALLEHLRAGPEHPVLQTRVAPGVDQFHGRGSGTAELAGLPRSAGDRLDLLLTVFDTAPIRWTVTRHVLDPDRTGLVEVLARRAGTGHRGVPQRLVVPYTGDPPSVVRVQVPDDVDWVLVAGVVGASDPQTPRHQPETERHTRFTAAP